MTSLHTSTIDHQLKHYFQKSTTRYPNLKRFNAKSICFGARLVLHVESVLSKLDLVHEGSLLMFEIYLSSFQWLEGE